MSSAQGVKGRPRHEFVMALFRPPALALVTVLARAGVRPEAVVVTHCLIGLVAAAMIAFGGPPAWLVAALLLQVKTVLDNADGALARSTGRVTELGRYLDTILDFVVNVALFAALCAHGQWLGSLLALALLTLLLSWDFNAERLYHEARQAADEAETGTASVAPRTSLVRAFAGVYDALFAPQDRLIAFCDERLFRAAGGVDYRAGSQERIAWSSYLSTAAVVDLGLSTQLLVLGFCLALGAPYLYVYLVWLQAAYLVTLQTVRVKRFRRVEGGGRGA